jgi:hypothetical protein
VGSQVNLRRRDRTEVLDVKGDTGLSIEQRDALFGRKDSHRRMKGCR